MISVTNRNTVTPYTFGTTSFKSTKDNHVINLEFDDDSMNSNGSSNLNLEAESLHIMDASVDKWFLNQAYYVSNPILNEIHKKIFNEEFMTFFQYILSNNLLSPDLLKIKVTEHMEVVSFQYKLACYARDR